ncbi:hypothetical protein G6F40_017716 [Rhizopus arrhizus]|nr:hypothetical protein G6F40_017716 [Rhizopus arrhizus]
MLRHKPAGVAAETMCARVSSDSRSELDASGIRPLQRHFHGLQLAASLPAADSGRRFLNGRVPSPALDGGPASLRRCAAPHVPPVDGRPCATGPAVSLRGRRVSPEGSRGGAAGP